MEGVKLAPRTHLRALVCRERERAASMLSATNLNEHVSAVLGRGAHLSQLKQLHALIVTLGHARTQFLVFKLVRFCALHLADLRYARRIFDHLPSPNIYLWTAMVTAYAARPDHAPDAFALYRDMVRRGLPRPNNFVYPHVLKSCPELSVSLGTKLVHAQVLRSGFGGYPVVQTALVDAYARSCCDIGTARQVFDEMSEKSVVSWTAMISGYTRLGQIENALLLFDNMPERDVPSWNALIAGCTQNGLFSEAISILRRMINFSVETRYKENRPNHVTIVCALSACGHTGMLQLGKGIHGYVYRIGLGPDSFISNSLVDMYGKCGSLKEARRIFERTAKRSLTSWNSMINCLALHGQTESAICVYEEMMQSGDDVIPDEVTFIGLLNACTHGGLVERGRAYFDMMTRNYGIEPRIEHYGCLIDLLGRAGRFDEALQVVRDMKMHPDEVVWGSLLNGCKIHGRTDLAEFALKKLVELEPNNGGYGAMLANLYVELGKWDEVRRVRKMLKEQDAYKTPGCSWVEVNSQLHQFYSVDLSHPQTVDIHNVLESLFSVGSKYKIRRMVK
ncbi:pentatricopeptide repeat-containing protein At1g33350 isoform X1 [Eucalyptus grandis]|uniref:pentatricopeptide repeat-containing protein At1g33350 isoform X1 n=1 Tax=Eucalyptus grandis TaxID=71139 RepID=UPI00192E946F|nr:pentatricopeptide repeat-containing protein At1g33350 isoform X1 [Eucalyptus grandis]